MAAVGDAQWLARIEDAGINASAPPEQLWIDGWLVRFSPGKAKRARCIQAVARGRLPVTGKLARCLPVYAGAGLRPYVRITPFSEPPGLDLDLERLGWARVDDTRVMVLPAWPAAEPLPDGFCLAEAESQAFAAWIAAARGSSHGEEAAHARRLAAAPVRHRALLLRDPGGRAVAGGQVAVEGDVAGLYDVFSLQDQRGRGLGRSLCAALLGLARHSGALTAYLQVDAANEAARRVYRRLGFVDAYSYHYRTPAPAEAGT